MGPIGLIARFTLLEAWRGRVLLTVGALLAAAIASGIFLQQIAITEAAQVQAAIIAAALRVCAVFLLATFVVASVVREYNDKVVELVLSQPVPRAAYVLGKFLGFAALALLLAMLFALPLVMVAPPEQILVWALSLALELTIVSALALFCVLTLSSVVPALLAVAGFYVLGRSIDAIRVIASSSSESMQLGDRFMRGFSDLLALVLPNFDRMTQSAWLAADTVSVTVLLSPLAQTFAAVSLLVAAALVDFYRQNF